MGQYIGKRIKEQREQYDLTQEELAQRLGCAQTTVANWENQANRAPDRKTMAKMAQIFNVTVDYLLGIEGFKNTIPCYGKVLSECFKWPTKDRHYPLKVSTAEYQPRCFALKIIDNDLEPFIIKNDYGIFKKTLPQDGDIVVVRFPEKEDTAMIRMWRCNGNVIALLPTNPHTPNKGILSYFISQESDIIKYLPEGKLIIEGVFIGIKREWKKIS